MSLLCWLGLHDYTPHGAMLSCGCGRWTRERCRDCGHETRWRDGALRNPAGPWCYGCGDFNKEPTK